MAFKTNNSSGKTYNSSASGSQSPSSETSSNTSPPSQTSHLSMDARGHGSGRDSANRARIDAPRSLGASRGGCWTCRIRRKKCDEQQDHEGGSCATCKRLKIDCLGWGTKRPEWMKDKKAVEDYKGQIKQTLLSNNMIRGQPRTSMSATSPSMSHPISSHPTSPPPIVPSQGYPSRSPSVASPRTRPSPSGMGNPNSDFDSRYVDLRHNRQNTVVPPISGLVHRRSYHGSAHPSYEPASASPSHFHHLPPASYSDPNLAALDLSTLYPSSFSSSTISTPDLNFDPLSFSVPSFPFDNQPQSFNTVTSQGTTQHDHVLYYFEHVRKMQFIFARGNLVTNIIYSIISQDPQGPVSNAVCALASLHNRRMEVIRGLQLPNINQGQQTVAKQYYQQACYQLSNSRGHHSAADAIAAIHLISFSLLSGGKTEWRGMLEIACDWLVQTGITVDEDPKYRLLTMTDAEKFATKAIMWLDIVSSMTLMRPPRYLPLYRRLLGSSGGYWGGSGHGHDDNFDLRMDSLTGCPDEVLLGIGEISDLAHWKTQQQAKGSLSVRELVRRGEVIEQRLRTQTESGPFADLDQAPLHPSLPTEAGVDFNAVSPTMPTSSSQSALMSIPFPSEDMRQIIAGIFRETALLYLHTVLNDWNPGVPEIIASVDTIINLFTQLPPSEVDRSLVFPLCLAGCLTNDQDRRNFLKRRLQIQDENIGNVLQARGLMEGVWRRRDVAGGAVDWREVMVNDGFNILLV